MARACIVSKDSVNNFIAGLTRYCGQYADFCLELRTYIEFTVIEQLKKQRDSYNDKVAWLDEKINELANTLNNLKSKEKYIEDHMPPSRIKCTSTDEEGNTITWYEDNPDWIEAQNKLAEVRAEIHNCQNQLNIARDLRKRIKNRQSSINASINEIRRKYELLYREYGEYNVYYEIKRLNEHYIGKLKQIIKCIDKYFDTHLPSYSNVYFNSNYSSTLANDERIKALANEIKEQWQKQIDNLLFRPALFEKTGIRQYILNIDGEDIIFSCNIDKCSQNLLYSQGDNDYGISGDCGLVAICNNYRLRNMPISENAIVAFALKNKLCSEDGGTNREERREILNRLGIESYNTLKPNSQILAKEIEAGKLLVLSVHKDYFWQHVENSIKDVPAIKKATNHCIMPYATYRKRNGDLLGFVFSDTHGIESSQKVFLSKDKFDVMANNTINMALLCSKEAMW